MQKIFSVFIGVIIMIASLNINVFAKSGSVEIQYASAYVSETNEVKIYGTINSGAGQQVTVMITNPQNKIEFTDSILSSKNGEFSFSYRVLMPVYGTYYAKLGGSGVDQAAMVNFSVNSLPQASKPYEASLTHIKASLSDNGYLAVSGKISSGTNKFVTMAVIAPQGNTCFVDSGKSKNDGAFEFSYLMKNPGEGIYEIVIGGQDVSEPAKLSFSVGRASNNANLYSLLLNGGSLNEKFSPYTTDYTVSVPVGNTSLKISPAACDINAKIKINGSYVNSAEDSKEIPLKIGINIIEIVVEAQDGVSQKKYTLKVIRGNTLYNVSADLSNDKTVTVTGFISAGEGKNITIAITDPAGNNEYANSIYSSADGRFAISYHLSNTRYGTYHVRVGGENVIEPVNTNFKLHSPARSKPHKYAITINIEFEGKIIASASSAAAGATITLSVVPNCGINPDGIIFRYVDGAGVHILDGNTFVMPANDVEIRAQLP